MNKFDRIRLLRALQLNTEENVLIASRDDWESHQEFLGQFSEYSVRTFREIGPKFGSLHYPIIAKDRLTAIYSGLLAQGLKLIVASPIDPDDAELAGCLLYDADSVVSEIALGPGTVRRVTHEGKIDARTRSARSGHLTGDVRVDKAISKVRSTIEIISDWFPELDLDGLLFEFSWYSIPVGWLHEKLIFWDISGHSRHEAILRQMLR